MSAADGRAIIYDQTLSPIDTIRLDGTGRVPVDLGFGGDGTGLLAALASDSGSALVQVRRTGSGALRRIALPNERTTHVVPFRNGTTFLTIGAASGGSATVAGGVASIVTLSPRSARVRLEVCSAKPVGAAVLRDGDEAFVACDDDTIAQIDPRLRRVVRRVPIGSAEHPDRRCGPTAIALSPAETVLLILCTQSGWLLYLDRATLSTFDSVDVGAGGTVLLVSRPLGIAVTDAGVTGLAMVDLAARHLRVRIPIAGRPVALAVSADGRSAYGATVEHTPLERRSAGRIVKIDLPTGRVEIEGVAPRSPTAVAVWPGAEAPVMTWLVGRRQHETIK